ncbi:unnamed protein product [Caretta caretta]
MPSLRHVFSALFPPPPLYPGRALLLPPRRLCLLSSSRVFTAVAFRYPRTAAVVCGARSPRCRLIAAPGNRLK